MCQCIVFFVFIKSLLNLGLARVVPITDLALAKSWENRFREILYLDGTCQKLEKHGKDGEDYDKDDREGLPEAKTVIFYNQDITW